MFTVALPACIGSSQAPAAGRCPEQSALTRLSMHLYLPGLLNEDSRPSMGRWLVLLETGGLAGGRGEILGKADPEGGSWVTA